MLAGDEVLANVERYRPTLLLQAEEERVVESDARPLLRITGRCRPSL